MASPPSSASSSSNRSREEISENPSVDLSDSRNSGSASSAPANPSPLRVEHDPCSSTCSEIDTFHCDSVSSSPLFVRVPITRDFPKVSGFKSMLDRAKFKG